MYSQLLLHFKREFLQTFYHMQNHILLHHFDLPFWRSYCTFWFSRAGGGRHLWFSRTGGGRHVWFSRAAGGRHVFHQKQSFIIFLAHLAERQFNSFHQFASHINYSQFNLVFSDTTGPVSTKLCWDGSKQSSQGLWPVGPKFYMGCNGENLKR